MPRTAQARRVAVDGAVRSAATLARPGYADAFAVRAEGDGRSAEQWARDCFEGAPAVMRAFLVVGWRLVLGMPLRPRGTDGYVFGWRIVRSAPGTVVLGVPSSALGHAELVLRVADGRAVLATFVRFERRGARAVWAAVGPVHRRAQPYLLGHAARAGRSHGARHGSWSGLNRP